MSFPLTGKSASSNNVTPPWFGLAETVVANGDIAKFYENTVYSIPVLNNDFGLASGVKSLTVTKQPVHGTVMVMADKTIQFTPLQNFSGSDSFEYQVCSNDGSCGSASVSVEIMDFDYKPILVTDTFSVVYSNSSKLEFDILSNDYGIYDEPIVVTIISQLNNGTIRVNSNNTITPIFKSFFEGVDSAYYRLCDEQEDCDTAMIYFKVKQGEGETGMFIPTGISPNGDGLNDEFYIPDIQGYSNMKMQVFTQWGALVYDDSNYQNKWDGRANTGNHKGNVLPAGTYYYLIKVVGTDIKIAGFIFLNR